MDRWKSLTVFYRFSKRCLPFNQNSRERNDKHYGKKSLRPYYGMESGTLFCLLCYLTKLITKCKNNRCRVICKCLMAALRVRYRDISTSFVLHGVL